ACDLAVGTLAVSAGHAPKHPRIPHAGGARHSRYGSAQSPLFRRSRHRLNDVSPTLRTAAIVSGSMSSSGSLSSADLCLPQVTASQRLSPGRCPLTDAAGTGRGPHWAPAQGGGRRWPLRPIDFAPRAPCPKDTDL